MSDTVASEAELIETYLAPLASTKGALRLQDDAGYFSPPASTDIVVSTDPIVEGVHFLPGQRPDDIAWKALAVNISDLAAKGAAPLAYTMALGFPAAPRHDFMQLFAQGLASAQSRFGCTLIGGDTDRTAGPLSISITAFGAVPAGRIIKRTTARVGDHIFVTGTLGDAALGLLLHEQPDVGGLALTDGDRGFLMARYLRPEPRLELAPALLQHASAALDISDGLLKDLARLARGACGAAHIRFADLPLSSSTELIIAAEPALRSAVISGGDDYEILFTVPAAGVAAFRESAIHTSVKVTEIGVISPGQGLSITRDDGHPVPTARAGWDHFG